MQLLPNELGDPVSTGTTLVAATFKDGVVIAADSRTSSGTYVSNRFADKLTRITDNIYCCRSGSAADTQTIADVVAYELDFYEREMGTPATVRTASNVFRGLCYEYRDKMLAGIICAGWDRQAGGQVYSISLGGSIMQLPIAIAGSGSTFIYGYVDALYKPDMEKEQCLDFCLKSVALAIRRDGSSSGVCRLAIITKDGVERRMVTHDKLPEF